MKRERSDRHPPAPSTPPELLTRREALARFGAAGLAIAGAGSVLSTRSDALLGSGSKRRSDRPNILLIIADDMRYDQLQYMPNVRRLIADKGRTFSQVRCNVPLCQPARVGLMTGQMSKYNGELGVGFTGGRVPLRLLRQVHQLHRRHRRHRCAGGISPVA